MDLSLEHTSTCHHSIEDYWRSLYGTRFLRDRFTGLEFNTFDDVLALVKRTDSLRYYICSRERIVGEASMDFISGKCYAVHFSFHPRALTREEKILAGRRACLSPLYTFKCADGSPFAETLLGLIPEPNRSAQRFAEDVGFVTFGYIPGAQIYGGKVVNAKLLILTPGRV